MERERLRAANSDNADENGNKSNDQFQITLISNIDAKNNDNNTEY